MSAEDWQDIVRGAEVKASKEKQKFCLIADLIEIKAQQLARRMSATRLSVRKPGASRSKQAWESRSMVEFINKKLFELQEQQHAVNRAERDLERLRERWNGKDPA